MPEDREKNAWKLPTYIVDFFRSKSWQKLWNPKLKLYAASLAYTTVLSLVPLLAVIFAIIQALGFLNLGLQSIEPYLYKNLAPQSGRQVVQHIEHFIKNAKAGTIGMIGLAGLTVTSYLMFQQVNEAVNTVVGAPVKVSTLIHVRKVILIFLLTPIVVSVSLGLSAYLPIQGSLLAFALDAAFFATVYKIIINRNLCALATLTGALFTAFAWELAKTAYSLYTHKALVYSTIYGSLSAVPLFILWIYLAWVVFLLGALATVAFDDKMNKLSKRTSSKGDSHATQK